MYQLRNTIGRSNVSTDPIHHFNECDDFFTMVVTCYVLVATMKSLNMQTLDDNPTLSDIDIPAADLWMESAERRKEVLLSICLDVVDQFASFKFNESPSSSSDKASYT